MLTRHHVPAAVFLWGIGSFLALVSGCGREQPPALRGESISGNVAGRSGAPHRVDVANWTLKNPPSLSRPSAFPAAAEETCAECHRDVVEAFSRNPMSRSWRTASHVESDGALPAGEVKDTTSGYQYRIERSGEQFMIEETVLDRARRWGPGLSVAADYEIGSGNHAVALAFHDGENLRLAPVAFFVADRTWRMSPGYDHQNVRFSRPITEGCIACHASDAKLRQPTLNRYEGHVTEGIGCRRCHGPAQEHVAKMQSSGGPTGKPDLQDLVNPSRLTVPRANDVCLQCHLQGIVGMHPAGRGAFTFRPGDRLSEHRVDFLVDSDNPASFGVASHGSRMMQSRCYTASGGNLTCIHCHDPHRPVADFSAVYFSEKCLSCHNDRTALPGDARHQSESNCATCHMPQRGTREGQHLVFTDHWIRRSPQPFRPLPAVLRPGIALRPVSTDGAVSSGESKLGAACIWLHEAIGPQPELLEQGIELLESLVESGEGDSEDAYWLGVGLIDANRVRGGMQVLEHLLTLEPDHLRARFRLAQAYRLTGEADLADSALQQCIAAAPHWTEPYQPLSLAQLQKREFSDAITTLRAELKQHESATAHIHLAIALMETSNTSTESQRLLERAQQLRPLDPAVQLNLAYFLTRQSDFQGAAIHYRRVLQLDPTNSQARQALQNLAGNAP